MPCKRRVPVRLVGHSQFFQATDLPAIVAVPVVEGSIAIVAAGIGMPFTPPIVTFVIPRRIAGPIRIAVARLCEAHGLHD